MNDSHLREYLLGRLSETERHEIENHAFEDDAFEDRLRDAEYDLLADWARNHISEADRAVVERRFSADKLAAARFIAKSAGAKTSRAWLLVAAAILLCLIPAGYVWREFRRLGAELQDARKNPPVAPVIATLALDIPTTRGAAAPVFRIPPAAVLVQVTLRAEPGYGFYEVRVESAARGLVFSQGLRSSSSTLVLNIPAPLIPPGDYDFVLSGQRDGSATLLATYSCHIQ